MNDAKLFINYINDHYNELYNSFLAFCNDKNYKFDADIFQDTIIKCYNLIDKQGYMKYKTEQGIKNYFFMSFKQNILRESQYARNQKRDNNIINLSSANEAYQNSKLTQEEKLKSDLYKDFATLYLLKQVEDNFDAEHFYLFRLKTFTNMTYAKLAEKTGIKGVRQKVVNVKNFLKNNVKQEDIRKEFDDIYGELL
jgi:RNA polymerase sigma factor (sigma-70 family)